MRGRPPDDPLTQWRLRWVAGRTREPAGRPDAGDPGRLPRAPWTASAVRGVVVLIGAALVVAGYWAWSGRPRAVAVPPTVLATGAPVGSTASAASALPAPSAAPPPAPLASAAPTVVVHVVGQVRRPGLVELPAGARVADAVDAAGGVSRPRAADTVNLARVVVDGEQIVVGAGVAGAAGASTPSPGAGAAPAPVDLNTADAAALDALPGIGPVLAGRIVAWRQANGPFRAVDELGEVAGIGDAIMSQLRPLVGV